MRYMRRTLLTVMSEAADFRPTSFMRLMPPSSPASGGIMCKFILLSLGVFILTGCALMEWAADQGFGWHPRDPRERFKCDMDPLKPGCAYYQREYKEQLLKWREPPALQGE